MSRPVYLHVYDLSGGLAKAMSMSLLGKQIDGVWHTGIVVGGIEYWYGGGIQRCPAAQSPFGRPLEVIPLGETEVPDDMLEDFLKDLEPRFNAGTYDLLTNNCNNFSEELSQLLLGSSIPAHITSLPAEVMATPFGQMMLPMIQPAMQQRFGTATSSGLGQPTPAAARTAAAATTAATAAAASTAAAPAAAAPSPSVSAHATPSAATTRVAAAEVPVATAVPAATASSAPSTSSTPPTQASQKPAGASTAPSLPKVQFEDAVRAEFLKVLAEGLDANAAGLEAVKRALIAVRQ